MNTELTYEIIGGTLGAIAILIGLVGANRQKGLTWKKAESEKIQLAVQIEALTKENQTFTEALALAKSAVDDFEQQLNQANKTLKEKENRSQSLDQTIAALRSELLESQSQLKTLQSQAEQKAGEYAQTTQKLKDELAIAKTTNSNLLSAEKAQKAAQSEAQTAFSRQIESLEKAVEKSRSQLSDLQTQLAETEKEKSQQMVKQQTLQTSLLDLQQQLSELSTQHEAVQQAKTVDTQQIEILQQQLSVATEEKQIIEQKQQTLESELAVQIAALKTEINQASEAKEQAETQLNRQIKEHSERQKAQENSAKTLLTSLREQIAELTQQRETLQIAEKDQASEQAKLRNQVTALEQQLDELAKASDTKSKALINEQIQPLREARDAAQQAAQITETKRLELEKQLQLQHQTLSKERDASRTYQTTADQSIQTLQAKIAELADQNKTLSDTVDNIEDTAPLRREIKALSDAQAQLNQQLADAQEMTTSFKTQVKTLEASKAALEEAMQLSQQVIVSLQREAAEKKASEEKRAAEEKKAAEEKAIEQQRTLKQPVEKARIEKAETEQVQAKKMPAQKTAANKAEKLVQTDQGPTDKKSVKPVQSAESADAQSTTKPTTAVPDKTEPQLGGTLAGKIFVLTGSLSKITYEQITETVTKAGGRINKMPSSKTDYIVVGENPGSKLKKAVKCNVPQLDEAQLLELFSSLP